MTDTKQSYTTLGDDNEAGDERFAELIKELTAAKEARGGKVIGAGRYDTACNAGPAGR